MKLIKFKIGQDDSELIGLTDRGMELYREQFACKQLDYTETPIYKIN